MNKKLNKSRFPYPVMTTLIQFLFTFLVVRLSSYLSRLCPSYLVSASSESNETDWERRLGSVADAASLSTDPEETSWSDAKEVFPLAIGYLLACVLDNVLIRYVPSDFRRSELMDLDQSRTQLPTYILFRITVIPLSLGLSIVIDHISLSILTIWSAVLAGLSLFLANVHFKHQISVGNIFLGITSSIVAALFPFLLLKTYQALCRNSALQRQLVQKPDLESVNIGSLARRQNGSHVYWLTLHLTSLASTILLIPTLLLSGEVQDIYRNCYVLDIYVLWCLLAASGIMAGLALILTLLLCRAIAPVMSNLFLLPGNGLQLVLLSKFSLMLDTWIDMAMCWLASAYLIIGTAREAMAKGKSSKQKTCSGLRNMMFPAVLYGYIRFMAYLSHGGRSIEHFNLTSLAGVESEFRIDYHSGWRYQKQSSFSRNDDYLGIRAHVDTTVNMSLLVGRCAEAVTSKGVDDVVNCLSYLANSESEYLNLPRAGRGMRASEQDPRKAKFLNADGHGNTLSQYLSEAEAQAASPSSIGTCAGPVIPFHVYWTGSASWRVEFFIKAYLYTQNLPCSRLWLWLDCDVDPELVNRMLHEDPILKGFRLLIERGDIILKEWKFPRRIPIPNSGVTNEAHEKLDTPGIVQDRQHWLELDANHIAFSPVAVSDAVRFIVLHLYGGLYCDMDVLLLRDMRPLLLPDPTTGPRAFAEQWVERCSPSDYNTAVISLPANSSLSSYLLRGGLRMGFNFHPRVIGRMIWRDGRNGEVEMLHNAFFDPLVTNLRREGTNVCTVPCHKNFKSAFMSRVEEAPQEWSNYRKEPLPEVKQTGLDRNNGPENTWEPSTNRSMENFFRGAWAYHIHNQVRTIQKISARQSRIKIIQKKTPHNSLTCESVVANIPRTNVMDGCDHASPRRVLRRREDQRVWRKMERSGNKGV